MVKHYDGKMIRLEQLDEDEPLREKDNGIPIKYKDLEFTFFPNVIVSDATGNPVFGYKFNDEEGIALYYKAPNAPDLDEALDVLIAVARMGGFTPMDIMDYLPEIYDTSQKMVKGELKLKDGRHPGWKRRDVKTD